MFCDVCVPAEVRPSHQCVDYAEDWFRVSGWLSFFLFLCFIHLSLSCNFKKYWKGYPHHVSYPFSAHVCGYIFSFISATLRPSVFLSFHLVTLLGDLL